MNDTPIWMDARRPKFSAIKKNLSADVVIIGGGITGLTAAYLLKEVGKKVVVLEKGQVAGGETGHTSAHLTCATDLRLLNLSATFGERGAKLAWQAGEAAIDLIETLVERHNIACDFQRLPAFLHSPLDTPESERNRLLKEAKLAKKLGFAVEFVEHSPLRGTTALRLANQARFQPVPYVTKLAEEVQGEGSHVFEKSSCTEIKLSPHRVTSNGYTIECDYLVIATHVPLGGGANSLETLYLQSKLYAYSTYVLGAKLPHGVLADALYWDTSEPYYYLRLIPGRKIDYVVYGGGDHKTGQQSPTEENYRRVERSLRKIVPDVKVDRRWSGQVIETNDGLPFMGETAERQFAATGFAGNGLTFGTIAGLMARDAALKLRNPWNELFSINRAKIRGGTWDYLRENMSYPYYYVRDWLAEGEKLPTRSVKRGEGKILLIAGERLACYRDEQGKLQKVSAVCTHMGCLVRFNSAEATWDCPCHGSRFAPNGEVIGGPAEEPLKKIGRMSKPKRTKAASKK